MGRKSTRKVEIITISNRGSCFLRRLIQTVEAQTYTDWHHKVYYWDDGNLSSTIIGESKDFLTQSTRTFIKLEGKQNTSYAELLVSAIEQCKADFFVLLDDDDSWHEEFLEHHVQQLTQHPEAEASFGNFKEVTEHEVNDNLEMIGLHKPYFDPYNMSQVRVEKPWASNAVVFRKDTLERVGGFNLRFKYWTFWHFMLKVLSRANYVYSTRFLSYKHIRPINTRPECLNQRHLFPISQVCARITDSLLDDYKPSTLEIIKRFNLLPEFLLTGKQSDRKIQVLSQYLLKIHRRRSRFLQDFYLRKNALKESVKPLVFRKRYYSDYTSKEEILTHLSEFDVVSFDVFDTLLHRESYESHLTLDLINKTLKKRYNNPAIDYGYYRKLAENKAREKKFNQSIRQGQRKEEVNLNEIYTEFCSILKIPAIEIDELSQLELRIEGAMLFVDKDMVNFIHRLQEAGKKIYCLSDMYLPNWFIAELLNKEGIYPDRIMVSSEFDVTKYHGGLYQILIEKTGCNPDRILHIGDNFYSDLHMAKQFGLQTCYLPAFYNYDILYSKNTFRFIYPLENVNEGRMAGLACKSLTRNPYSDDKKILWKLGYELVGPLHLSYLVWIINSAICDGLEKVHFLARDGFHLYKAFQLLNEHVNLPLEADYLFASRQMLGFPEYSKINKDLLYRICLPSQNLLVKDFLSRLGLDYEHFLEPLRKHGFPDPDALIKTDLKSGEIIDKKQREAMFSFFREITPEIEREAQKSNQLLMDYFSEMGVNEKSAIVDVGWMASSCKSIHRVLQRNGLQGPVAYYFGTWEGANPDNVYPIKSFFFHLGLPNFRAIPFLDAIAVFELFFSAPHPTIIGIEKSNGQWNPIYSKEGENPYEKPVKELLYEASYQFIKDYCSFNESILEDSYHYIQVVIQQILKRPTSEIAEVLGAVKHKISYGEVSQLIPIAARPDSRCKGPFNFRSKKSYLENSLWKAGTLAMLKG